MPVFTSIELNEKCIKSEHACKASKSGCFVQQNVFPKVDVSYDPFLDGYVSSKIRCFKSEHACYIKCAVTTAAVVHTAKKEWLF